MKKIKEYKGIIIIVLVLILGAFYWFQIRPAQIIKNCIKSNPLAFETLEDNLDSPIFGIRNMVQNGLITLDKDGYQKCLRENGLK